jgi:hypothetical protein
MSTFNIILETTSLPNVLVEIIHEYNNFRPVAYQFCQSYLKNRLGLQIFQYLKVHKMVGQMVEPFEKLVESIVKMTQDMTANEVCDEYYECEHNNNSIEELFSDLEQKMFPIVGKLENKFGPDGAFSDFYQDQCSTSMKQTQSDVMPSLIRFAKGKQWVSPTDF